MGSSGLRSSSAIEGGEPYGDLEAGLGMKSCNIKPFLTVGRANCGGAYSKWLSTHRDLFGHLPAAHPGIVKRSRRVAQVTS